MRKQKDASSGGSRIESPSPTDHDCARLGERPRVEVRLLKSNSDGKLEELSCFPVAYYGSCPNVGDTIVDGMLLKPTFYAVERRYFVQESLHFSGWALIVREIDPMGPQLDLWEEWQAATKFWDDVADQELKKQRQELEKRHQALLKRVLGPTAP